MTYEYLRATWMAGSNWYIVLTLPTPPPTPKHHFSDVRDGGAGWVGGRGGDRENTVEKRITYAGIWGQYK
jgi:hypothetical protein